MWPFSPLPPLSFDLIMAGSSRSIIEGLTREHSRKPDEAYAWAERLMPGARRVELFSRQTRPGWASWGNEVGKFDPPYSGDDDFAKSIDVAYSTVRERVAAGGPGWVPQIPDGE